MKVRFSILAVIGFWGFLLLGPTHKCLAEPSETWPVWPKSPAWSFIYEPLSFTIAGADRDYLSWVKTKAYPDNDNPSNTRTWGALLYLTNLTTESTSSSPNLESRTDYGTFKAANPDNGQTIDLLGLNSNFFVKESVFPEFVAEWVTPVSGDAAIANQYFPSEWTIDWETFMTGTDSKNGYAFADSGYASPLLVWPDNVWLSKITNYRSYRIFLENTAYSGWGDAVCFLPSNEGLLHALGVDPFAEKWAFMPTPASRFSIFQQHWNQQQGVRPRLSLLGGPIAIADIENGGNWKRLVIGTVGLETDVQNKSLEAWDEELEPMGLNRFIPLSEVSDTQLVQPERSIMKACGIYAIKIADMSAGQGLTEPSEEWSVSVTNVASSGGSLSVNVRGELPESLETYQAYAGNKRVLGRPIVGITGTTTSHTWHLLLVGVDLSDHLHVYDIDPFNGEIFEDYQLDPVASETSDPPNEIKYPSRAGATLSLQNAQSGEYLPLLDEVYIHAPNGVVYKWSVGNVPRKLVRIFYEVGNVTGPSQSVQDFDVTFRERIATDPDRTPLYHRLIALSLRGSKPGTEENRGIAVLDVTNLEYLIQNGSFDPDGENWLIPFGFVNNPRIDVQSTQGPDGEEVIYGWSFMIGSKVKEEDIAISSPLFVGGKLLIVSQTVEEKDGSKTDVSHVYVVDSTWFPEGSDPLIEDVGTVIEEDAEYSGGAVVNEEGIFVGLEGGGVSHIDAVSLGLESELGSLSELPPGMTVLYWRKR